MTTLQELINRMDVWTPIYAMSEVRKVNALDQAIRELRREHQPHWLLKKTTLRIFKDVFLYPVDSNHGRLAFLSSSKGDVGYNDQPRFVYTSYKDFIENAEDRNLLAEIWENGVEMLAVRNKTDEGLTNTQLNNAETVSEWAGTDDAGTPVLDNVVFKTGNGSIRVPVTSSAGTATVTLTYTTSTSDTNYKRKYYFRWVYLDSAPTSVTLRLRKDASNYSEATVTTQHAGQAFVADDWNLLAFDLNTATETGTVDGTFGSEVMILTGAATGTYYFDSSYLKGWILEDYRFYSKNNVLDGSTYQEYFAPDSATYDTNAYFLGDTIWSDIIMLEACGFLLSDQKEESIRNAIESSRRKAWDALYGEFPSLSPHMITQAYRFQDDYTKDMMADV